MHIFVRVNNTCVTHVQDVSFILQLKQPTIQTYQVPKNTQQKILNNLHNIYTSQ